MLGLLLKAKNIVKKDTKVPELGEKGEMFTITKENQPGDPSKTGKASDKFVETNNKITDKANGMKEKGVDEGHVDTIVSHPELSDKDKHSQLSRLKGNHTRTENKKTAKKGFHAKFKAKVEALKKKHEQDILDHLDKMDKKK